MIFDYKKNLSSSNGGKSVYDILALDPNNTEDWEIIKDKYIACDIHKVIIDGDVFTNYGDFQFSLEKSYVKEPSRSESGVVDNLNSFATFVTPRLIINFSVMSIDDYRAIMRKDLEKNEFVVECYDPVYNIWRSQKMYFAPSEMAKLQTISRVRFNGDEWEDFVELVGVREYSVEMIGTNSDLDNVSIVYHLNPPLDTGVADRVLGEPDVYVGQEVVIGQSAAAFTSETFGGKYKFTSWHIGAVDPTDNLKTNTYNDGSAYTIYGWQLDEGSKTLVLYAQWESTENHSLLLSYGLADPVVNDATYEYITSIPVSYGKSIGVLPTPPNPYVEVTVDNSTKKKYPYTNGGWYKTAVKATNSVPVESGDLYWLQRDATIYRLYDVESYLLTLYIDGKKFIENLVEYNTSMNLPTPVRDGYSFDGWYTTSGFEEGTKQSGGYMPPYAVTLYGRWEKAK